MELLTNKSNDMQNMTCTENSLLKKVFHYNHKTKDGKLLKMEIIIQNGEGKISITEFNSITEKQQKCLNGAK